MEYDATKIRMTRLEDQLHQMDRLGDIQASHFITLKERVEKLWDRVDTLMYAVLIGSTASLLMSAVVFILVLAWR